MTSPIRIKASSFALSQSVTRLFLRYFVGMVVGFIPSRYKHIISRG